MLRNFGEGQLGPQSAATTSDLRRKAPRRKHFYTWVATDAKQLELSEKLVLNGLQYHQAYIAGVNTISTDDITRYDETQRERKVRGASGTDEDAADVSLDEDAFISASDIEESSANDEREIVVLVHGFAGGAATWAQNWSFLAAKYRLYAIDLPGFARSERRPTNARSLEDSMAVMTGYLERWCKKLNFPKKVTFLAHSFGCFVCAHFAMRFPEFVKTLVLTEPWGINKADPSRIKSVPLTVRLLLHIFYLANPLAMLRGLGPAGPAAFKKSRPDFRKNWSEFLDDPNVVYDYLYHCNARSPAVGEDLFRVCCHEDVAAKVPLSEVLPQTLSRAIPVGILFGADSWITPGEALEMASVMRLLGFTVLTDTVENAGHQIFTDNVTEFNEKASGMVDALVPVADLAATMPLAQATISEVFSPISTTLEPIGHREPAADEL